MGRQSEGELGIKFIVALVVAGALLLGLFVLPDEISHRMWVASGRPQRAFCQSNLRQLQSAALMYATDYDDRFPRRPSPGGDWMVWKWSALRKPDFRSFRPIGTDDGPLTPYTRYYRIIACPDDSSQQAEDPANVPHSSYTWNNALCGKLLKHVPTQPLVWDRAPFHKHGRNVASVNGERPVWVAEKDFAPLLAN